MLQPFLSLIFIENKDKPTKNTTYILIQRLVQKCSEPMNGGRAWAGIERRDTVANKTLGEGRWTLTLSSLWWWFHKYIPISKHDIKVVQFILNQLYFTEITKNCVDASKHGHKIKFMPFTQKRKSWQFKIWKHTSQNWKVKQGYKPKLQIKIKIIII